MKKLIKLCAAVLAAAALFAFTGCSARTPVTADEFKKQAEAAGFTVTDSSASANAEKYLSAIKSETGTELAFLSFSSESTATEMYTNLKSSITSGTDGDAKNVDSSSYNKYTLVNGELNHILVRMNKTIVYGKATTTYKNQIEDFFSAIKY